MEIDRILEKIQNILKLFKSNKFSEILTDLLQLTVFINQFDQNLINKIMIKLEYYLVNLISKIRIISKISSQIRVKYKAI